MSAIPKSNLLAILTRPMLNHCFVPVLACGVLVASVPGCGTSAIKTGPATTVAVHYATSRAYTETANKDQSFGNDPAAFQVITYGNALVEIPAKHASGSSEGTRIASYDPVPKKDGMPIKAFFNQLAADTRKSNAPLLLYVHGYNNSFADAAHRAAHFSEDLHLPSKPVPAVFSWPSRHNLFGYWKDEDSVLLNARNLRRFLSNLHTRCPGQTVLVGHSMGCRELTFALAEYAQTDAREGRFHIRRDFSEMILIEPDIDLELLKQNISDLRGVCGRITIYTSRHDIPLAASAFVHQDNSAGKTDDPIGTRVDVIDASALRKDFLGHSYDGEALFDDMAQVVRGTPITDSSKRSRLVADGNIHRFKSQ